MNRFVRFIFFIIILAAFVNLTIVLAANYVSQRTEKAQLAAQHDKTVRHYNRVLGSPSQTYLAVEWQKTGPFGKVLETSILVQPFILDASNNPVARPLTRLLINGNSITVEGLAISFDDAFPDPYDFARGKTLYLLTDIYETQHAATRTRAFVLPHKVPDAARVDMRRITDDELGLWHLLGDPLQVYFDRDDTSLARRVGVSFSRPQPDTKILANGALYKIFYGANGLTITPSPDTDIYGPMHAEAAKLP